LLARLSASGRVHAIDISSRMIEIARGKVADARVIWHVADAAHLTLSDAVCDRVICCSIWPHFDDRRTVAAEMKRVLRPGGSFHVWHLSARRHINEIHASAGPAVSGDMLAPATDTAALLAGIGLQVSTAIDAPDRYLVTAVKPEAGRIQAVIPESCSR
jgi:ubiquinone/menaquinone biosynthesis C-methylase UbiE